eukprot:7184494-Pyramimonas_sp.AAC.1
MWARGGWIHVFGERIHVHGGWKRVRGGWIHLCDGKARPTCTRFGAGPACNWREDARALHRLVLQKRAQHLRIPMQRRLLGRGTLGTPMQGHPRGNTHARTPSGYSTAFLSRLGEGYGSTRTSITSANNWREN